MEIIAKPKYFPVIGEAIARRFQKHNLDNEVSSPLFGQPGYAWGGESIRVETFTVPPDWLGKKLLLIAEKQGHFRLMLEDELVLEGEVGKLASKQLEGQQQSVTLFVSLLKSRPDTQFILMRHSMDEAIILLEKNITVAEKGKLTGILQLTLEDTNQDLAVQTLNKVTNTYVRENVEHKSAEAQKTLEFLEKQLPLLKDQLEASTTALNDYRTRHGSVDLTMETQGVLQGVVELQAKITQLQQDRDVLRQRFTESYPSIVSIDMQIARLQALLKSKDKKIEILPATQQDIMRLEKDVKVNTELYTALLNNAQTLRVSNAGTLGNVSIIDYAVLHNVAHKPQKAIDCCHFIYLGVNFSCCCGIYPEIPAPWHKRP